MEDSKVNVTVGIINKGFLVLELCIGLGICAFLCSIITHYQWYSLSWQLQTNKRFQVIQTIEDVIQTMRADPVHYQSLFPYNHDGIMITMTEETYHQSNELHLIYVQARWQVLQKVYTMVVPLTLIVPYAT